jgi:hypothetical protein
MPTALTITVDIRGASAAMAQVQEVRNALTHRGPLHGQMALDVRDYTRQSLAQDTRHTTAAKLGATPTGHRKKSGAGIEAVGTDAEAILRIPRDTGLGRAFGDVNIAMRGKMLTIPASAATYGKTARDFPQGVLKPGVAQGRFPALVFAATGEPAFWLVRKVHQRQDRTLLPSDEGFASAAQRSAELYLRKIIKASPA